MADLGDGQGDRIAVLSREVPASGSAGGRVGGDGGQEGQGEHGEGDVPVPRCSVPDLIVVESDLALGGLETLLDAPADTGDADEFGQCRGGG